MQRSAYEFYLSNLKEWVRREPDADAAPVIQGIAVDLVRGEEDRLKQLLSDTETLLSDFVEEVRREPDADAAPVIQEFKAKLVRRERDREQRAMNKLLLGLYENDARSLKRDITKIILFGTAKAAPAQRAELLRCLCEGLSWHTKEDFASILEKCDRIEAVKGDK